MTDRLLSKCNHPAFGRRNAQQASAAQAADFARAIKAYTRLIDEKSTALSLTAVS